MTFWSPPPTHPATADRQCSTARERFSRDVRAHPDQRAVPAAADAGDDRRGLGAGHPWLPGGSSAVNSWEDDARVGEQKGARAPEDLRIADTQQPSVVLVLGLVEGEQAVVS